MPQPKPKADTTVVQCDFSNFRAPLANDHRSSDGLIQADYDIDIEFSSIEFVWIQVIVQVLASTPPFAGQNQSISYAEEDPRSTRSRGLQLTLNANRRPAVSRSLY